MKSVLRCAAGLLCGALLALLFLLGLMLARGLAGNFVYIGF